MMLLIASALRRTALVLSAAGLLACSTPGPMQPGQSREEVLARWGEPRAVYQLPSGQRLIYSPQPGQVQSLDFDGAGRLVTLEQVLTAQKLGSIVAGKWRAADVQLTFGPPAKSVTDGEKGSVWTYFFREYGTYRLARIHLDPAGVVVRTEFADDPAADQRYR